MLISKRISAAFAAAFALFVAGLAGADERAPEIYMDDGRLFSSAWGYAAGGYDVVAYFGLDADAEPVAGDDAYVTNYKGVAWRFSSEENLQKFAANPDAYRPQYGGYCAWAMARDMLAKGDPEVWYVYEGKLYLNVSKRYKRKWLKDIDDEIVRANANWPGILNGGAQ